MYGTFNILTPVPGLDLQRPKSLGRVFYVEMGGSDSNEGTDPDFPLETLQAGIDKCTNYNNDYVYVLDCWSDDTEPINMDCPRMHLIGLTGPTGFYPRLSSAVNTIDIEEDYCELAGFAVSAGSTHACIRHQSLTKGRIWIHNMWLGHTATAKYGIQIPSGEGDLMESLIEDCIFGDFLTDDGISIEHNATRTIIRNNLFDQPAVIGIHIDNTMAAGWIIANIFKVSSDADGAAIKFDATASDGAFIDFNRAGIGTGSVSNELFQDLGTNHWGVNWEQIVPVLPKTS